MHETQLLGLEGQPGRQLVLLESRLADAALKGVVKPLPRKEQEFNDAAFGPGHLRVLRNRLFCLGYLGADSGEGLIDDELRLAVRRFQQEANLTVDGWVGAQTWQALQELFAFEPPTELCRWLADNNLTPALRRAAHLRLFTYGLMENRPQLSLDSIDDGLRRWNLILFLLEDRDLSDLEPTTDKIELVGRLFESEALLPLIAANRNTIQASLDGGHYYLNRFLTGLVKIELWLLGYEGVKPDGVGPKELWIKIDTEGGKQIRRYSPLYSVIREFWEDQGLPMDHAMPSRILLRTIDRLATVHVEDRDLEAERRDRTRDLLLKLEAEGGDHIKGQWEEISLGARIWDGAKRLWRFLTNFLRKTVDWVKQKFKLILRAAYQAAAEAFSMIHRSIRVFTDTVELLQKGEIKSPSSQVAVYHDRDFDFKVFVARTASANDVKIYFERLRIKLERFGAAVHLLKLLLGVAMIVARLAAGPWAWWSLVRTLIQFYGEFSEEDARIIREGLAA